MTEELKEICRELITGERESKTPVFFYGEHRTVNAVIELIALGASRNAKQPVCRANGYALRENRFHKLADGVTEAIVSEPPAACLLAFDRLEALAREENAGTCFEKLFDEVCDHSGQLVLGADCPPEELGFLGDRVCEQIRNGVVCRVDGEELGLAVPELMDMGLWPTAGRFAALYRDGYLDLFPTTQTETLSEPQTQALEEMRRTIVRELSDQYRGLLAQRVREIINRPGIYNDPVPEDWSAETIAAAICYVFWNRFNCCPEGYEVDFAKSGLLGKYLRRLEEKDR